MSFFNKKEDVIKIELTPHGRKLLSRGRLKPVYYSFYDDDILYDSERGGFTETNLDTKSRILSETPSNKPQVTNIGVESNFVNTRYLDDFRVYTEEIGTTSHVEKKSPAWEILFLHGEISSSTNHMTSSKNTLLQIPQIECEMNYTMSVDNELKYEVFPRTDLITTSSPKLDGSFVKIKSERILMDVLERNGFDHKDSFELEVFIYDQDGQQDRNSACNNSLGEYTLRKLRFLKDDTSNVHNDLLMSSVEGDTAPVDLDLIDNITTASVEYYMDIAVDMAVPRYEVCQSLHSYRMRNIYLDSYFDCSDIKERQYTRETDVYQSEVLPQEDCE